MAPIEPNYSQRVHILMTGLSALEAAIAAVSKYGGASAGFRTMLDALIPAAADLRKVSAIDLKRLLFFVLLKERHFSLVADLCDLAALTL